jgi:hypothetical protein
MELMKKTLAKSQVGKGAVAHADYQSSEVVEAQGGVGMLQTEGLLPNSQGALEERFRLGGVAHEVGYNPVHGT